MTSISDEAEISAVRTNHHRQRALRILSKRQIDLRCVHVQVLITNVPDNSDNVARPLFATYGDFFAPDDELGAVDVPGSECAVDDRDERRPI